MSERAYIEGLASPHPLGLMLPGLYHDDEFAQSFTEALDEVLAPIICSLDCLDAYLDPWLAPSDFVEWLAAWVGLIIDENWTVEHQRELLSQTVELYKWRGTRRGVAALIRLYVGSEPDITDSGGVTWSAVPLGELPGEPEPMVRVRVRVEDPATIDTNKIEAMLAATEPAHVRHEVEVVVS